MNTYDGRTPDIDDLRFDHAIAHIRAHEHGYEHEHIDAYSHAYTDRYFGHRHVMRQAQGAEGRNEAHVRTP